MQLVASNVAFAGRDSWVVAVAYQDQSGVQATVGQMAFFGAVPWFPILADQDGRAIQSYGLVNGAYYNPAVFVIDPNRTILWKYISTNDQDRPTGAMIASHLP